MSLLPDPYVPLEKNTTMESDLQGSWRCLCPHRHWSVREARPGAGAAPTSRKTKLKDDVGSQHDFPLREAAVEVRGPLETTPTAFPGLQG